VQCQQHCHNMAKNDVRGDLVAGKCGQMTLVKEFTWIGFVHSPCPLTIGIEKCREGQADGQTIQQSMVESQALELSRLLASFFVSLCRNRSALGRKKPTVVRVVGKTSLVQTPNVFYKTSSTFHHIDPAPKIVPVLLYPFCTLF
jgi:hypothetical protein